MNVEFMLILSQKNYKSLRCLGMMHKIKLNIKSKNGRVVQGSVFEN